jgi:hypothetical protein
MYKNVTHQLQQHYITASVSIDDNFRENSLELSSRKL